MKMLSGAIIVLSGALLGGTDAIARAIDRTSGSEETGFVIGIILILVGCAITIRAMIQDEGITLSELINEAIRRPSERSREVDVTLAKSRGESPKEAQP